ncbi:MAG: hypothetical protein ACO3JL_08525 [Myxococcota bacterium]
MRRRTLLLFLVVGLLPAACATTPAGGPHAAAPRESSVPPIERRESSAIALPSVEEMKDRYDAAGRPTVGFVGDRYRLPVGNPLGGARIVEGNVFGAPYTQTLTVPSTYRPWSLEPLSDGYTVQQLALVQQDLSAAGVRFVEVSAADASRIVDGERSAFEAGARVQWNQLLPSGADLLVTFQEAEGIGGPLFLIRVVRMSDGALLSLRTGPAQGGALTLRPLLVQSLVDAFAAAAAHPAPTDTKSLSSPGSTAP